MKLRNKKTGEIIETVIVDHGAEWEIRNMYTDEGTQTYDSLAELNAEWRDAPEEPKEYWYIDWTPEIGVYYTRDVASDADERQKEIGNYFETKEEAELALRKLKAFKRLKDKGFRFNGWSGTQMGSDISYIREGYYDGCTDDMDLLFSGEDD